MDTSFVVEVVEIVFRYQWKAMVRGAKDGDQAAKAAIRAWAQDGAIVKVQSVEPLNRHQVKVDRVVFASDYE